MVYRVYVEKKPDFANESIHLLKEIQEYLNIRNLKNLRIMNRYDVENIDDALFQYCIKTVFSEPQVDNIYKELNVLEDETIFATEYLPGQFDQRADSAAQCIQLISKKNRPLVATAKIYILKGKLTEVEIKSIKQYLINPMETKVASLDLKDTLKVNYEIPKSVEKLTNFINLDKKGLQNFIDEYHLAMDLDDLLFCQKYFREERRDPTITEIKVIDTYWSDHCRHTTFLTTVDKIEIDDPIIQVSFHNYLEVKKNIAANTPIHLMDLATIGAKYLKKIGKLNKLDVSDEINACSVKIKVTIENKEEDWLLLFKNETHNHPTEIEPFGGAATCIGGAIRDPLSGRAYVYAGMRVTGAANPLARVEDTICGKLPQRKIVQTAANGYSSYGNQIGLATGIVDEIYHPGYAAKRMEIGAVIGATPLKHVKRLCPSPKDVVILLGGKTGRDGCGGATGSSKSHTIHSIETCGSEVQKGNAPEERKLQRLFRNKKASLLIKRCNDFGAGGVSVAIGELADGLEIDLNQIPKKYEGLDGTELAISESQERMAVVVDAKDEKSFIAYAKAENLEATRVAIVTDSNRLVMKWNNQTIVDISRDFLNSNGIQKHINAIIQRSCDFKKELKVNDFITSYKELVDDLNICSKKGLVERFDSTIGATTVLMPFGGKYQLTPIQAMVNKISTKNFDTDDCSIMAYGYNPFISEKSPYHGAYLAVVESICKLIATGASFDDVYLTFQEYFAKINKDAKRFGIPFAALLGAFQAQMDLGVAAIGGKDSMSGSFENIDVPPTLVSFAVTTDKIPNIISNEFKEQNSKVILIETQYNSNSLPNPNHLIDNFRFITTLIRSNKVKSCYSIGYGGIAEAIFKMSIGNKIGFSYNDIILKDLFSYHYGSFILEVTNDVMSGKVIGYTNNIEKIKYKDEEIKLDDLLKIYENKLEKVYPYNIEQTPDKIKKIRYDNPSTLKPKIRTEHPKVLIPVFPGTNCEYDSAKALEKVGAIPEIIVIRNISSEDINDSIHEFCDKLKTSHAIFIPGGFSGGDEPDGSGKFITAFFRNEQVRIGVHDLLNNRDGLICGICNGFQALIKLGLLTKGQICDIDENTPTLTYNTISRHQSKIVRCKITSNLSPWLKKVNLDEVFAVPISHGEGRFYANSQSIQTLIKNGQIAKQYVDLDNNPTADIRYNPSNSTCAVEAITSPDGRIIGMMGHAERAGDGLYKNYKENFEMKLFESLIEYYK